MKEKTDINLGISFGVAMTVAVLVTVCLGIFVFPEPGFRWPGIACPIIGIFCYLIVFPSAYLVINRVRHN